jgi:hypothetical protein
MDAMEADSKTTPCGDQLIFHFEECYRLTPLIARRLVVRQRTPEKGPGVRICIVGCSALGSVIAPHPARLKEVEVYVYEVSQRVWSLRHQEPAHRRCRRANGSHLP